MFLSFSPCCIRNKSGLVSDSSYLLVQEEIESVAWLCLLCHSSAFRRFTAKQVATAQDRFEGGVSGHLKSTFLAPVTEPPLKTHQPPPDPQASPSSLPSPCPSPTPTSAFHRRFPPRQKESYGFHRGKRNPMSAIQILHSFYPFADANPGHDLLPAGTDDYTRVRTQQRKGRKTLINCPGNGWWLW